MRRFMQVDNKQTPACLLLIIMAYAMATVIIMLLLILRPTCFTLQNKYNLCSFSVTYTVLRRACTAYITVIVQLFKIDFYFTSILQRFN